MWRVEQVRLLGLSCSMCPKSYSSNELGWASVELGAEVPLSATAMKSYMVNMGPTESRKLLNAIMT